MTIVDTVQKEQVVDTYLCLKRLFNTYEVPPPLLDTDCVNFRVVGKNGRTSFQIAVTEELFQQMASHGTSYQELFERHQGAEKLVYPGRFTHTTGGIFKI